MQVSLEFRALVTCILEDIEARREAVEVKGTGW